MKFERTTKNKCFRLIWSCKTIPHTEVAKRYLNLAYMGDKITIQEFQYLAGLLQVAAANIKDKNRDYQYEA
jgi:hypothetical protein